MKKFKFFMFSLLAFLFMSLNVNAEAVSVDTTDEFINAVANSGEIILDGDLDFGSFTGAKVEIAVGTEISLDLNGHTISGESSDEKVNAMLILNNGSLVIYDNSQAKTGKITMTDTKKALGAYAVGSYTIKNKGNLVVNSGTIENTGETDVPYPIDSDTTNRNTKVTINGGTIIGTKAAIRAFCNSTTYENEVIINDGIITAGYSAVWVSQVNKKANNGYLEVNGGTITGVKSNGIYVSVFDQSVFSNIKVKITGGTIKNNSLKSATFMYEPWEKDSDLANANIDLEITGGTFINENAEGRAFVQPAYLDIPVTYKNISGGTFSTDVTDYIAQGYVCKQVNNNYVVAKEKEISILTLTNGTITVDKTKAIVGETITIEATAEEGYELSSIEVLDDKDNKITVSDNKFTMPDSNVTINALFTEVTITSDLPTVNPDEEVLEVSVGIKDIEKTEQTLLDTIANDASLAEKIENTSVNIEIEIENVDSSNIDEELVDAMNKRAGKAVIASYFDINIELKDKNNTFTHTISELTEEIELMVLLPEDLKNNDDEVARKYYIVRQHINTNGQEEVDLLDAKLSEDGKHLVFKTNKFSTYAIAYADEPALNNPNTGDNIMLYIIVELLSVVAIGVSITVLKKRYSK